MAARLKNRVRRLEEQVTRGTKQKRIHIVQKRYDETNEKAKERYAQKTGRRVDEDDDIIFVVKFCDLPARTL